jgi:hypothetical protein
MSGCETNKPTCICNYCITNLMEELFPSQNKTIKVKGVSK